jgi:hypothetical protein
VIRGDNVTNGYENNPAANAAAFVNGWLRTGDQGVFDQDGYLCLTGRLKELINRGGEKIAPGEIDEVLMSHPGVMQAVTFPVPHATLGEAVAAAIVPNEGMHLEECEIRHFALESLPDFKVPARIVIVADIPKGSTGKIQRTHLADKLAHELAIAYSAPVSGLEQLSATTFERILQREHVGRNDNFFALGGDSVRAAQVIGRLAKALALKIPPTILFHYPTPALLAGELLRLQDKQEFTSLVEELQRMPAAEADRLLKEAFGDDY